MPLSSCLETAQSYAVHSRINPPEHGYNATKKRRPAPLWLELAETATCNGVQIKITAASIGTANEEERKEILTAWLIDGCEQSETQAEQGQGFTGTKLESSKIEGKTKCL